MIVAIATDTGWRGPSAYDSGYVCRVYYDGNVNFSGYNGARCAARPVVSIPRSKVNINVSGSGDSATLSLTKVTQ